MTICPKCGEEIEICASIEADRARGTSSDSNGGASGNPLAISLPRDFDDPDDSPIALTIEKLASRIASQGVKGELQDIEFVIGKVSYGYLHKFCRAIESRAGTGNLNIGNALLLILFDRKMKALLLEGIESIELNFRSLYSRLMAEECGPFAHRHAENFKNEDHFNEFLEGYARELDFKTRNKKGRIWEQCEAYGDLPVWEAVNLLGLGTLSKLYRNTRSKKVRFGVCDEFGVSFTYMQSWLRTICEVRNRCAHFDDICVTPLVCQPKRLEGLTAGNDGVFYACVIIQSLIEGGRVAAEAGVQFAYTMDFLEELTQLMNETHNGVIRAAGFPDDWPKQLERASSIIESVERGEAKAGQSSNVIPVDVPRQGE